MNIRRGLFRLWIVVSVAWALGSGIIWYRHFAAEQTQIAALDECGKIYLPLPEGFVVDQPSFSDELKWSRRLSRQEPVSRNWLNTGRAKDQ
jgi:hypothetical protein